MPLQEGEVKRIIKRREQDMSNRTISKSKRRKRGGFHGTRKPVQREHKDRLFRLIFQDEEDLLELYNAVNGTDLSLIHI